MKNIIETLVILLGALGLVFVVMLIVGFPVMILWNWLMPAIFGIKAITFWQAIGLQLLAYMILPTSKSPSKTDK